VLKAPVQGRSMLCAVVTNEALTCVFLSSPLS
jgi:hypothetical protein